MRSDPKLTRRGFVAANIAVAATAAATGSAQAMGCSKAHADTPAGKLDWATATAEQLESLIGERFRVRSEAASELVLKLVAVEPGNSGPHRPADLPRAETVVAVFDSPDKAPMVECGAQMHRFSHPLLGAADLFATPSCLRSGGHVIEVVLG